MTLPSSCRWFSLSCTLFFFVTYFLCVTARYYWENIKFEIIHKSWGMIFRNPSAHCGDFDGNEDGQSLAVFWAKDEMYIFPLGAVSCLELSRTMLVLSVPIVRWSWIARDDPSNQKFGEIKWDLTSSQFLQGAFFSRYHMVPGIFNGNIILSKLNL